MDSIIGCRWRHFKTRPTGTGKLLSRQPRTTLQCDLFRIRLPPSPATLAIGMPYTNNSTQATQWRLVNLRSRESGPRLAFQIRHRSRTALGHEVDAEMRHYCVTWDGLAEAAVHGSSPAGFGFTLTALFCKWSQFGLLTLAWMPHCSTSPRFLLGCGDMNPIGSPVIRAKDVLLQGAGRR